MEADYEKAMCRKAERELRIVRIVADGVIPAILSEIEIVQALKQIPQQPFEFSLVGADRTGKSCNQCRKFTLHQRLFPDKCGEILRQTSSRTGRTQLRIVANTVASSLNCRFGANAGKLWI